MFNAFQFVRNNAVLLKTGKHLGRAHSPIPDIIAGYSGIIICSLPFVLKQTVVDKMFWMVIACLSVNSDYIHRGRDSIWHSIDRTSSLLGIIHCLHTVLYRLPFQQTSKIIRVLDNRFTRVSMTLIPGSMLLNWSRNTHNPWLYALAHFCWHIYPVLYSILLRKTILEQ